MQRPGGGIGEPGQGLGIGGIGHPIRAGGGGRAREGEWELGGGSMWGEAIGQMEAGGEWGAGGLRI
jgi:hypothetical protein